MSTSVKNFLLVPIVVLSALSGLGCSQEESGGLQTYAHESFSPGQTWEYKTREGEEDSRVVIGKINTFDTTGPIVHVNLHGLKMEDLLPPCGDGEMIWHAPIELKKFSESVVRKIDDNGELYRFQEGYTDWLLSFQKGEIILFSSTLSELVDAVEATRGSVDGVSSKVATRKADIARIDIPLLDSGYMELEPVVVTSPEEFEEFLDSVSSEVSQYNRQEFIETFRRANVNFETANLLFFPHVYGSSSTRFSVCDPSWEGEDIIIYVDKLVAGTRLADLNFYALSYTLSKRVPNVIFSIRGGRGDRSAIVGVPNVSSWK